MAFQQFKFDKIATQSRGIFNIYIYETEDTLIDVLATDYFLPCRFHNESDWAGSIIKCKCSDGMFELEIVNGIAIVSANQDLTGWAQYQDTQYTVGAQFSVLAGTDTILPNNAGLVIESQLPSDITSFYSAGKITGRNGDGISITVDMIVTPSSGVATYVEVWFDIGSPVGELYRRILTFPKGAGVELPINFTVIGYTLETWEANGALVYIKSNGPITVYNQRYVITRTHKAR